MEEWMVWLEAGGEVCLEEEFEAGVALVAVEATLPHPHTCSPTCTYIQATIGNMFHA